MLSERITLMDLVADERLSNPKRYLRMALGNALLVGELEKVSLWIGRSGNGIWPHYFFVLGTSKVKYGPFDGQTHKAWTGNQEHHDENWSGAETSGVELYELWRKVITQD